MPTALAATLAVASFLSTITDRLAGWFGPSRPATAAVASAPAGLVEHDDVPRNGHANGHANGHGGFPPRVVRSLGGRLDPEFFLNARLRSSSVGDLSDPLRHHAWYYAILTQRATQVTQAPFRIFRRGDDDGDDDVVPDGHPLVRLFAQPNPSMTGSDLWYVTNIQRDESGEAWWVLDRERPDQYPDHIWPMAGGAPWRPTRVLDDGSVEAWEHRHNGKLRRFEPWQVVLFLHPDPSNPLRGLSPRLAAQVAIETDVLLRDYNADFFRNGAQPAGWLKVPGNLSLDDHQRLESGWKDKHGGPGNGHRMAILEGGMEWVATTISQRDMEFLDMRRWSREELAAVYHWPLWMLTDDAANFATASMSRARVWFEVVIPILRQFEAALESQLFRDLSDDVVGQFDLDRVPALVEYRTTLWDTALKMKQAGVSLQETNRVLDLGLQEQDGWDEVWRPVGEVTTSDALLLGTNPTSTEMDPTSPEPSPDDQATPNEDALVASLALNGAQVNAIVAVAKEVAAGVLPLSSALAISTTAFPITDAQANAIFGDIEIGVLDPNNTSPDRMAEIDAAFVRKVIAATTTRVSPRVHVRAVASATLRRYWRLYRKEVAAPAERLGATTLRGYLRELADEQDRRFEKVAKSRAARAVPDVLAVALEPLAGESVNAWQVRELRHAAGLALHAHRRAHGTGGTRVVEPETLLDVLFPIDSWNGRLRAQFRPYVQRVARLSGAFTEGAVGTLGVEFDPLSPRVAEYLEDRVRLVVGLNQRAQAALAQSLQEGFAGGESVEELRARVQGITAALRDPDRAMRIARTESASIANGVRFHMGEPGEDTHVWSSANDDVTRDSHRQAEAASRAEPVIVGRQFSNGLLFPGDPGGAAEEVIHCRCATFLLPRNQEVSV